MILIAPLDSDLLKNFLKTNAVTKPDAITHFETSQQNEAEGRNDVMAFSPPQRGDLLQNQLVSIVTPIIEGLFEGAEAKGELPRLDDVLDQFTSAFSHSFKIKDNGESRDRASKFIKELCRRRLIPYDLRIDGSLLRHPGSAHGQGME